MSNGYTIPFEEMLKCSICQDRIKDARSLPCGHTYCSGCLKRSADATYPRGSINCSECKKKFQLGYSGAESLPCCFTINSLVDDINETFGGRGSASSSRRSSTSSNNGRGDQLSLGKHGFQVKETFSCSFCLSLMRDARYLPCGHSYCRECLEMQPRTTPGIRCAKCLKDHNLPAGGINGLPVAYRINSIAAEIRSNGSETSDDQPQLSTSSQNRGYKQPSHRHSPDTRSRPLMEDVDEAKKRAQARAGNQIQVFVRNINGGKTTTITISSNANVGDLMEQIKTIMRIAPSQQRLTFSGCNLDDNTRALSSYGIGNLSHIDLNARLRGGSQ
ncbi:uncharacterized protein LOC121413262 [Lytechinus variegatus]|uniref:uncharacterized protein LOC121413262 n=1 Tax=Lytechinus variegatus TaxID=7654 RepID=UPI001BB133A2|nr:uncharacterized protein LOC121413262 [Lytechinus variegatus]